MIPKGSKVGQYHTCALTVGGGIKCWGYNAYGQLGDGTTASSDSPVDVSELTTGATALATGYNTACALVRGGRLNCWGSNLAGQLGDTPTYQVAAAAIASSSTTANYHYYDPAHAHAVSDLNTGERYEYDENGNMTYRSENGTTYSQVFDAENRLVSVTVNNSETTSFVYDGEGNLAKRTDPDGNTTLYFFGLYEVHLAGGTETDTLYYPAGDAMRVTVVSPYSDTLSYILSDHLGSTSVVTTASGVEKSRMGYYPFALSGARGETRYATGSMPTYRLFTGQQEMSVLGCEIRDR